jgi:Holliday junction DNA helicase RuvA
VITRLTGKLESVDDRAAFIAVMGGEMAYEVLVPAFLAERLKAQVGAAVTFTTFQYLESQGQGSSFIPRLVGFQSAQEREFFELFTTVKGIGNRRALRAMAADPAVIARAIMTKDAKALTKLPEIGKRMAETIIAELSGKVDTFLSTAEVKQLDAAANGQPATDDPTVEEAVQALVALGETRTDAQTMVARAQAKARRDGRELKTASGMLEAVFGGAGHPPGA